LAVNFRAACAIDSPPFPATWTNSIRKTRKLRRQLIGWEARAVGCHAACVARDRTGFSQIGEQRADPRSTVTVDSFIDLAELLGC
jgi:hypothetical protein